MYNDLLNYFENECCISNIFAREQWGKFWFTILIIIVEIIVLFNVNSIVIKNISLISVFVITIINILIGYFNILKQEYKKEFPDGYVYFGWLEMLQFRRENTAVYKMQLNRMKRYCKKENFTNEQIQNFIKYLDEDLDKKYPKDRMNEMFLTLVIPATVSIATVYITNNQIKDFAMMISIMISSVLYAWLISFSFHQLLGLKKTFVNQRNNLLELKDVLRNIDMNKLKEEKKIIVGGTHEKY